MVEKVQWRTISRDDFERIVNVLLTQEGEALGFDTAAPSGRGGDEGIDIEYRDRRDGTLIHVLQLKHFPEGFSSGWGKSRKPQIKKSFDRAEALGIKDWTLVVPEEFTASERKWVFGLAKDSSVRVHIMGTVELDRMLAKYPDVQDWSVRDAVHNALSRLGRRDAAPRTLAEASGGLTAYMADQDTLSLYWGLRLGVIDGRPGLELYAKRADAAAMEPLSITVNVAFGVDDSSLSKLTKDVLGYGRNARLDLPASVVRTVVYDGPADWFAGTESNQPVSFIPVATPHVPEVARIDLYDEDGTHLGHLDGSTVDIHSGPDGGAVEVTFEGVLRMYWRFPKAGPSGSTDIEYDAVGATGVGVYRVTRVMAHLPSAHRIKLSVGERSVSATFPAGSDLERVETPLLEYAEDLAVIERLADVTFAFPRELPGATDRVWTRIARMVLEGRCALIPNYSSMDATLSGVVDEGLNRLLDSGAALLNASVAGAEDSAITVLGRPIAIPETNIFHPQMKIADADEVKRRLIAGTAEDLRVTIKPVDGTPFRIYSTAFLRRDVVVPEPWGITGIDELPALFEIIEAANPLSN